MPLIGTGTLGSRVWSGPAITVIGIDVPTVDDALNAVSPYARAKLNVRVHPEQDAAEAQAAVVAPPARRRCPSASQLEVEPGPTGNGFAARTSSPAYDAARAAWSAAWGAETVTAGGGGSIPLVSALAAGASPEADVLLVGTTDGYANIHGPNERVLLDEFEKTTLADRRLPRPATPRPRGGAGVSAEAAAPAPRARRRAPSGLLDCHRAGGQQGPAPRDPVPRARASS